MNATLNGRRRNSLINLYHRRISLTVLASVFLACWLALPSFAQSAPPDSRAGVSAGGKWMEFSVEDKMTEVRKSRFVLAADNGDGDDNAQITLFCSDGKMSLADFRPNTKMAPPNRPGFWGQPQMEVTVRVDHSHSNHGWNWVNGHFLSMDKGTARELIGAQVFKIEFATPRGPQIADFSPAGLDLGRASHACGLTPKRP